MSCHFSIKTKMLKKTPICKRLLGSVSQNCMSKVSQRGEWKMSEFFSLQWFFSWKPQHEASLDLPGANAVGQVITWVSKSILHSQALSSLSWPLYDKKHFAKKQPYLLAEVINYWSRRGSLSASKQHSTFFFLSYFPLKLAAFQKTSWRHPRRLLLLEKLPPSPSLLVHPSGLKQFPHCEARRFLHHNGGEGAEGKQLFCDTSCWCSPHCCFWRITSVLWILKIVLFWLGFFVAEIALTTLGIHLGVIQPLNFPDNFLFACCQQLHCY